MLIVGIKVCHVPYADINPIAADRHRGAAGNRCSARASIGSRLSPVEQQKTVHFINSGVPHVVIPVAKIDDADVRREGAAIRHHKMFSPNGTNVDFIEKRGPNKIAIRTYERGVEDETLACGTGIVASALIFAATENCEGPVTVLARGGDELQVSFEKVEESFRNVTLTGPAEFVFEGTSRFELSDGWTRMFHGL